MNASLFTPCESINPVLRGFVHRMHLRRARIVFAHLCTYHLHPGLTTCPRGGWGCWRGEDMLSIRLRFPVQARLSTTTREKKRDGGEKKNEKEKERIPDVNNPGEKEKAYRYTFLCSKVDTFPNATPLVSVVAILVWVSALRLSEMLLSILFLEKDNEDTRIVGRREMKIVSLFFFAFLWILTFLSFLFEFVKTSESCWDVFGIIFQLNNSITSNGKKKDQSRWNNLEMISNNLHSIPSLYLYYA